MTKVGLIIFRGNRTGFYPPQEAERLIANGRARAMTSAEVIAHRERIAAEERTWAAAWRKSRDPAEFAWRRSKAGQPYAVVDGWCIVLSEGASGFGAWIRHLRSGQAEASGPRYPDRLAAAAAACRAIPRAIAAWGLA